MISKGRIDEADRLPSFISQQTYAMIAYQSETK